jgi:hypothetical protein
MAHIEGGHRAPGIYESTLESGKVNHGENGKHG